MITSNFHRPVFFTGPQISPNLAGRLAAAFSLCQQIFKHSNPKLASECLEVSVQIYKSSQVNPPPSQLVTAAPFDFYPETEWRDDMELAASMLYLSTGDTDYLNDAGAYFIHNFL